MWRLCSKMKWAGIWLLVAVWMGGLAPQALAHAAGDRVVLNLSLEPDTLDPTIAPSASIGEIVHYNVLEGLVKIEENGSTSPLLASKWSISADGKTYRFALRKRVTFHDGRPFDSAVVRYSFERAKAAGSKNKLHHALFDNITKIDTPDDFTVVLHLAHADADTLFRLGESPAVVLHPETAGQTGEHPVGTGPYEFRRWQRGYGVTLRKYAGFRDAARVQVGEVLVRFINDPQSQAAAQANREVDVFFNVATRVVTAVQGDSAYQLLVGSSGGKGMLALNHRNPVLRDVRVRRAMTHAIDREGFIRTVLDGRGKVIGSHFSPTDAGYLHLAGLYPYDPARARELMREAGVALPVKLTLTLPPTPYARVGAPLVVQALDAIGFEIETREVSWTTWMDTVFKGDFDLTLINHVEPLDYAIYADPNYYFGYDSPEFRQLLESRNAALRPRERQVLFTRMQRLLANDAVNVWIFAPQISVVARKGLRGLWMNYPVFVHDLAALRWE